MAQSRALDTSLTHLLHRAMQAANAEFERTLGEDGITPRQLAVLSAVAASNGLSQSAVCAATGIDRSTLADIVARLLKAGLLRRTRSKEDARAYEVRLTEAGQKALTRALPAMERSDATILGAIPASQRNQFREALLRIASRTREG